MELVRRSAYLEGHGVVGELVVLVEEVAPARGGGRRAGEEGGQPHPQHEPHTAPALATFPASSLLACSFGLPSFRRRGLRMRRLPVLLRGACDWVPYVSGVSV